MRIFQLFESMMGSLASIPGLSFLYGYVISAKAAHTRFGQRKGDYQAYVNNVRAATGDAREMAGRPRRPDGGGSSAGGEGDSPDEYNDDYPYDEDSVYADGGPGPVDDYPTSDDHHSYFDDDYRNS